MSAFTWVASNKLKTFDVQSHDEERLHPALVEAGEPGHHEEGLIYFLDRHGQVSYGSAGAEDWLSASRRARLAEFVTSLCAGEEVASKLMLDGYELHVMAMHSTLFPGVPCCYLATLVLAETPLLDCKSLLTPRQQEIARFAVVGATNAEIAKELQISTETVRSHIKQIYSRLEVCSRLELVRRFREEAG